MKYIFLSFFICLITVPAEGHGKTLNEYFEILNAHPKIEAISAREKALRLQADSTAGLPDPSLFVGVENVPVSDPSFDRYLPTSKTLGFSQGFPGFGSRNAQKNVFLASADNSELMSEYAGSQLRGLFLSRLADLERVNKQLDLEQQKKPIIVQLQEYYDGRIAAGDAIFEKTFKAEAEQYDVEQRLNSLNSEKAVIEADLVQLVGEVPADLHPEFREKSWDGEVANLYPVKLAKGELKIEEAKVSVADKSMNPDFGLSATYKFREEAANGSFDGDDWFTVQLRMSVPLWASSKQLPQIEAAESNRTSAQMQHRDVVRAWQKEVARIQSQKLASSLNIETLNKKESALQEQITAMERTYSTGQTSLEPVLQAELARLSLLSQIAGERQRYISLVEELNTHIAENENNEQK